MRALLFTTGSPFARAVRIVLDELELEYERREEITTPTVAERAKAAPTLQVPTLWDGGVTLWESGLIVEYLLSTYPDRSPRTTPLALALARPTHLWQDRLVQASVQTLGTAGATIGQMKWGGLSYKDNAYLTRSAERLPHLLTWLEGKLPDAGQGFMPGLLSAQDVFLACHIGYIENRPLGLDPELPKYPKIAALLHGLNERESFVRNPILWWEPGVVGYADDGKTPIYRK